jgi:OmpA-OmpF porin, OOP family
MIHFQHFVKEIGMKKLLALALFSSIFASSAFAEGTGFYGAFDLQTWSLTNLGGASNPSTGYRIAGGYHFTPNWGAEIGYAESGSGDAGGLSYKVKSTQIAAVGTYPINEQFDVFAKLGYAANKLTGDAISGCNNCSKNDLMYGIGGQYNINKQIGIRLQYESLGKVEDSGTDDSSATNVSLGVVYNF